MCMDQAIELSNGTEMPRNQQHHLTLQGPQPLPCAQPDRTGAVARQWAQERPMERALTSQAKSTASRLSKGPM